MRTFSGGEFIIMGVPADTLDAETLSIIEQVQPSGFILYARNIKTPQQLRELTDSLRRTVDHEPIITIDQEGGRVSRLKEIMAEPPSAKQLALSNDRSLIEQHGLLIGKLLRLFGFNLNLAPVLDIGYNEQNDNSLRDRTYGSTPEQVAANALAFLNGMRNAGILSCGKHFPGYSLAAIDPHNTMPTVTRTLEEMIRNEWIPFERTMDCLDTIMIGHVSYPLIDPSNLPASLSSNMMKDLIRDTWHFRGCLITDDLDMGAINKTYDTAQAACIALAAGGDLMLVCHDIHNVPKIAESLTHVSSEIQIDRYDRIVEMRKRLIPPTTFSWTEFETLNESVKELHEATTRSIAKNS